MSERRLLVWWCLLGLLLGACSLDSSSEVASTGRQAVDVAPSRSLTSVVSRTPVEPVADGVPAAPVIPPGSLPDALAFKAEPSGSVSADASGSTTTTVASPAPSNVAPTTSPVTTESLPESTTTEPVEPEEEPRTSVCPAPVFDNGSLDDSVLAVGRVDADAADDVVVVGLDDDLAIRVVVDFGDGGQSDVGVLASFGEFGSPFVVEFTGIVDRPLRVHRGSESVLVWVEDCVPLRAAND